MDDLVTAVTAKLELAEQYASAEDVSLSLRALAQALALVAGATNEMLAAVARALPDSLVVGPDEVLIVRIPEDSDVDGFVPDLLEHFAKVGIGDRTVVVGADGIEFSKVAR